MSFRHDLIEKLISVHSFVPVAFLQSESFESIKLSTGDHVLGVYINDPESVVIFTYFGMCMVRGSVHREILYKDIMTVRLPDDSEVRELELVLQDDEIVFLDFVNETEEFPDIYAMSEFVTSQVYWPHRRIYSEEICNIDSARDLSVFLAQQEDGFRFYSLTSALKKGFPSASLCKAFDIDPELFKRPDVWRALAFFLCSVETEDPIENSVLWPGQVSTSNYKFVGTMPRIPPFTSHEEIEAEKRQRQEEFDQLRNEMQLKLSQLASNETAVLLSVCEEESKRGGWNYLGSEYLLLGLMIQYPDLTRRELGLEWLTVNNMKEEIVRIVGKGRPSPESQPIQLTPNTLRTLKLAFNERQRDGSKHLEPVHLLTALIKEDCSVASRIIENLRARES